MDGRARSAADGPGPGVPAQHFQKSAELFSPLLRESGTGFYLEHCFLLSTGGKCVFRP